MGPYSIRKRATERLGEMLYWNTKEALGDGYADSAKAAMTGASVSPITAVATPVAVTQTGT